MESDSQGEHEKKIDSDTENGHQTLNTLPDPDAGLNNEERAKIVSRYDGCWLDRTNFSQDRKLLWRLDFKLIPWLSFLYLISFLGTLALSLYA